MDTDRASRPLAAREIDARKALHRLRDCSREIELLAGSAHTVGDRAAAALLTREVRVLRAQAQRIRTALSDWDTADAPVWSERIHAQLELLATGIAGITEANARRAAPPPRAVVWPNASPAPRRARTEVEVEGRIYDYLYRGRSADPALG
ncbi:MAG TPA: hypothetical protein VKG38_02840 [Solirubrobacteraceae bacterium]|nr:hypothetical protein [Solirubrobacteraceae bacterium]